MKNHVKVEGNPGLVRDTDTNAILNTDSELTKRAKRRKEQRHKIYAFSNRGKTQWRVK